MAKQAEVRGGQAVDTGRGRWFACVLGRTARSFEFFSSPVCRLLAGLLLVLIICFLIGVALIIFSYTRKGLGS